VTSEVMPGVERSFTSFLAAAEEATLSRIFAGVHFLFDLPTGRRLGSDIADFIVDNFLTSRETPELPEGIGSRAGEGGNLSASDRARRSSANGQPFRIKERRGGD
jgi:hypothetical protein